MRKHRKDMDYGVKYGVFVDGVELKYCVEFDTVEGWATYRPLDDQGKMKVIIKDHDVDIAELEKIYGKVTFNIIKLRNS